MYLLVNPCNGKKKPTQYFQLEYSGSSFSQPLEFKMITPKKKRKRFDSSRKENIGDTVNSQRCSSAADNILATNEIVPMFSKFVEYCDLKNDAKSIQSFVNFSQFEEVCVHSSINTKEVSQITKLLDAWMQESIALLLGPQRVADLLNKFAINMKLIFTYCWIVDTFPDKSHTLHKGGLTSAIKPWLLVLLGDSLFIDTLQSRYNLLVKAILDDKSCAIDSTLVFLDSIHTLKYVANMLKLDQQAMSLNLRLHFSIPNMSELVTKISEIQSIVKDQVTADRTSNERCASKLQCDIFDGIFCSKQFYENILCGRITTKSFLKFFSVKRAEIQYDSRRVDPRVLESIRKEIMDVSLSENYSKSKTIHEFMVEVLQVQSSELFFDASSFGLYWEFVVRIISNNCNISLEDHFRSFAILMSYSTTQGLMSFIFDKIRKFLHERITLLINSELDSIRKLLKFAHLVDDLFSFEQKFALNTYERDIKELFETPHVHSFVEVKTLHYESFRDLPLLKSRKVNLPQNVTQSIRDILHEMKPENKKIRLNTSYNTVEIDINYGSKICQLTCSAFIAVVLLAFEEVDELSYEEIKQKTGISDSILKSSIASLKRAGLVHNSQGLIKFITNPGSLGPSLLIT